MTVWDELRALAAAGRSYTLTFTAENEIKTARLRQFAGYDYYRGTHDIKSQMAGRRPRCQRRGCTRYLRKNQPWVCSSDCAQRLIDEALCVLAALDYGLIDRVDKYNSSIAALALQYYKEARYKGVGLDI